MSHSSYGGTAGHSNHSNAVTDRIIRMVEPKLNCREISDETGHKTRV